MSTSGIVVEEYRGVDNLFVVEITKDDNAEGGGYVPGEPFQLAGVAEVSKSTKSDSNTSWYDNVAAIIVNASGSDEVKVKTSVPSLETTAKILGLTYDATLNMLVDGERSNKYFAMGYRTKTTSGAYRYVWRLKGQFAVPDETNATENDGTDTNNLELTYTGISTTHKFVKAGTTPAPARGVVVGADKADVSTWFTAVQTPDTVKAKT